MALSYLYLFFSICPVVALETMFQSGILEQVLRNINIPWLPCDEEKSWDEEEGIIRNMHKTFKRGLPFHNAFLDILQGRIRPCKENKFVMVYIYIYIYTGEIHSDVFQTN